MYVSGGRREQCSRGLGSKPITIHEVVVKRYYRLPITVYW